jgi:hypothetical protein
VRLEPGIRTRLRLVLQSRLGLVLVVRFVLQNGLGLRFRLWVQFGLRLQFRLRLRLRLRFQLWLRLPNGLWLSAQLLNGLGLVLQNRLGLGRQRTRVGRLGLRLHRLRLVPGLRRRHLHGRRGERRLASLAGRPLGLALEACPLALLRGTLALTFPLHDADSPSWAAKKLSSRWAAARESA